MTLSVIICALSSYLIGSIPFALLVSNYVSGKDIRKFGSGNIGATNAVRVLGKKVGAIVFALDLLKGFAMPFFCRNFFPKEISFLIGACAVIGHIFPIWLKFKGGKGVSTSLGVLLGVKPILGTYFIAVWVTSFLIFRYSSISSILAQISSFILIIVFFQNEPQMAVCSFLLTLIILFKHRTNISTLINKQKPRQRS